MAPRLYAAMDPLYKIGMSVRRLIERRIQNPLAAGLLRGEFHPGETIHITVEDEEDGKLRFETRAGAFSA